MILRHSDEYIEMNILIYIAEYMIGKNPLPDVNILQVPINIILSCSCCSSLNLDRKGLRDREPLPVFLTLAKLLSGQKRCTQSDSEHRVPVGLGICLAYIQLVFQRCYQAFVLS